MFTVGEFATLARVSKRLLRYYDEIGLLKPAHSDTTTGYRYYHAEQMARLNRILVLKELGLSLDQIRQMLNGDVSTHEMQGMLLLKKAEIERTLRAELHRIRMIEARLNAIRNTENDRPLDVVIKPVPAQAALSVRSVFESFEEATMIQRQIRTALPERSGYGLCFVICHDDEAVDRNMNLELGCLVEVNEHAPVPLYNELQLTLHQLPAVPTMATTIVIGSLEVIHASYGELGQWVENNGYRLAGSPREIVLNPSQSMIGSDLVSEIQFPVQFLRRDVQ